MAQNNYQNLAPLIKTNSLALVEYFAATIAEGNLNVKQAAHSLEGEGVEWSNTKIGRVLNAVHSLYHSYKPDQRETFREELASRCISTKNSEVLLDTLVESFNELGKRSQIN